MVAQALVSTVHRSVVVPYHADVARSPMAREMSWQGQRQLVVPHDVDHTRMLRNMNFGVASPIESYYDWRGGTPWDIQKKTAAMLTVSPRAYVLNQMRTGKTRSVLYACDYLMSVGAMRKALIVAPLSTVNIVWGKEIFVNFPGRTSRVLYQTKAQRLRKLAEDVDFYIINHDGPETILEALQERDGIDCIVFDELTAYRERRTERWRAAKLLVEGRRWAWGLTGKPRPKASTDVYGQALLLTPDRVPKHFNSFRDNVMLKVSQFKWVDRHDAAETVQNVLKPSVMFTRNDVAPSAEPMYIDRECELSPTATAVMKGLVDKFKALHEQGSITAVNSGVLLNKLMQVATGWVYTDEGKVIDLSSPTRLAALKQTIEETDHKVLVFAPYVHALEGITAYLRKEGFETAMVYGDTPSKERDQIFHDFQHSSRYDVIVAHPQCMAHGLLLTAADTAIWFGCPPSNELYGQANDRIALPGLSYQTGVVHIIGSPYEKRRYSGLRAQETSQQTLLAMLAGVQE